MHLLNPSRPPRASRRRAASFTLIELLVTIGIIIFVLSVTVVAFTPMFRTAGVKSASRVLRAAADGARIRAIQQRRPVRFEAQLIPNTLTQQWRVSANAGDATQEWRNLPEFVAVATNADKGVASRTDGREFPYRGTDPNCTAVVEQISITFGPDGAVKRYVLGGHRNVDGTFPSVSNGDEDGPTTPFAIRLTDMRDLRAGVEPLRHWLVVIPLTGGLQPYETETESF